MSQFVELADTRKTLTQPASSRNGCVLAITVTRGASAHALLANPSFVEQWRRLQKSCPWTTPFQTPDFAASWYDVYQPHYEPILVQGHSPEGELVGLLTLASPHGSRQLIVAGTPQSEYQVWLASPAGSEAFLEAALECLRGMPYRGSLTFEFLPPRTPLDGLRTNAKLASRCQFEPMPRPLLRLGEASQETLRQFWRNKTVRNQLNRLKRLGPVRLERLTEPAQLEPLLDEIIAHYDCRIGALLGYPPFWNDPLKKRFLLRMMAAPDLLHVTVFRAGETLIGANLGFQQEDNVCLGVFAYSPFQARCSPGKLLLMMLADHLGQDGFTTIDLTPDGDWKARLATEQDTVHKLTVHLRQSANLRSRLAARLKGTAKRLLHRLGLDPQQLSRAYHRARSVKVHHLPGMLGAQLVGMFRTPALRIYCLKLGATHNRRAEAVTAVDRLDHLLAGIDGAGRPEVKDYFSSVLKRLEVGCRAHTCVRQGKLEWGCWSFVGNGEAAVPEVEPVFIPPARSAVLFGFHVARGAESDDCLREVIHDLAGANELDTVYFLLDAGDGQTCRDAESIGAIFERLHAPESKPSQPLGETAS